MEKRDTVPEEIDKFVNEYMWPAWKKFAPDKAKYKKQTKERLYLFLKNSGYTLQEVREAIEYYLRNTDSQYIRYPLYFIGKKIGNTNISDLEQIIINLRKAKHRKEKIR